MMDASCKFGKVEDARELLEEMRRKGLVPDLVHYSTLINGYCLQGKLFDAWSLFEEIKGILQLQHINNEVSKTEGRVRQTTNVVIGGTVADDSTNEWLALDQKVNTYPSVRGFTAIGTGGEDFVHSMIVAVESVLERPIPEEQVKQKISSRGKYVSVNIGPVLVSSSEQVQAVYNAMRRDDRMKYFL